MIRNNVAYSILIFILIGIISSCQKPVEYPIIPAIAFKELYSVPFTSSIGGTVYMTMSFTDGDGNVGLGQKDTLYPYKYNLYVKYILNIFFWAILLILLFSLYLSYVMTHISFL